MVFKKRFLCVVYEPGNFQVWLKFARYGVETGEFEVILWSPYYLSDSVRFQAEAHAAGTVYVEEVTVHGGLADISTRISGWLSDKPIRLPKDLENLLKVNADPFVQKIKNKNFESILFELSLQERWEILREVDRLYRRINFCEDWLVRLGIDALLLAEDNVERDSYGWVLGANRRSIKTLISSYGNISDQEAIKVYKTSTAHAVNVSKAQLIHRYFPQWMAVGDDFAITRLPFTQLIARELTGMAPFNPWVVNTGNVDTIALESNALKQSYLKFGFSEEKLQVIGHPFQDTLASVFYERQDRRAVLFAKYKLSPDKDLAVVGMPPNRLSSRSCVYKSYADLISAFAHLPKSIMGLNVVASLHPNITLDERELIIATGIIVVEGPVAELLPLADIYISSASSTIKWALGCGIPVIDFNCYGHGYPDYLNLPQVISVSNETEFRSALLRFGNHEDRAQLIALARSGAEHWGKFDGRAIERLAALCFGDD